jgi:hypothetical protein
MKPRGRGSFGVPLKSLREAAGFTQEELATIAGLSVHAVSALSGPCQMLNRRGVDIAPTLARAGRRRTGESTC